jgi:hypothetical protein
MVHPILVFITSLRTFLSSLADAVQAVVAEVGGQQSHGLGGMSRREASNNGVAIWPEDWCGGNGRRIWAPLALELGTGPGIPIARPHRFQSALVFATPSAAGTGAVQLPQGHGRQLRFPVVVLGVRPAILQDLALHPTAPGAGTPVCRDR